MTEPAPVRILALVVTFKVAPADSSTLKTLLEQTSQKQFSGSNVLKVIFDNSPERQPSSPAGFEYIHDPRNRGLQGAYQWAYSRAREEGIQWLLLLDQDSSLPSNFLDHLAATIRAHESDSKVAAIVPKVKSGSNVISPHEVMLGRLRPLQTSAPVQHSEITAINSGTAIRRTFLDEIGGFESPYWLDFLDYWIFRQIYKRGWHAIVSDSVIQHDLSVRDYRNKVSPERYRNIVKAEAMFVSTERPKLEIPIYLARLLVRSLKQVVLYPRLSLTTVGTALWTLRQLVFPERTGAGEGSNRPQ